MIIIILLNSYDLIAVCQYIEAEINLLNFYFPIDAQTPNPAGESEYTKPNLARVYPICDILMGDKGK